MANRTLIVVTTDSQGMNQSNHSVRYPNIETCTSDNCLFNNTHGSGNSTLQEAGIPGSRPVLSAITYLFMSINITVAVAILAGNCLVVCAFIKYKFIKTGQNSLLLSLSISDLLNAPAIISANVLLFVNSDWKKIPCLATASVVALCFVCQIWSIVLVTVDRWLSVHYPLKNRLILSRRKLVILISAMWLLFTGTTSIGLWHNRWAPGMRCFPFRIFNLSALMYLGLPLMVLPLMVMPVMYIMLTRYAFKHHELMKVMLQARMDPVQSVRSREIKTLKTLGMILGIMYASWVPTIVVLCIITIDAKSFFAAVAQKIFVEMSTTALFLSSVLNPVVYHRSSPTFRKAFRMILFPKESREAHRQQMVNNLLISRTSSMESTNSMSVLNINLNPNVV